MAVTLSGKLSRPLGPLREGDEVLWLEADTIALVRWDQIERLSLLG